VICRNCGLVFTDPRPNESEIEKYYSKDYRIQYKGTYTPKPKHIYRAGLIAKSRFSFLEDLLGPGDAILDVGAGGGEFVYLLNALGYNAVGVEPNEGYAGHAREKLGVSVECGFIQQKELAPRSYDVITLHHVFEHLDDPRGILIKIRDAVKENGIIVIEVPNVEATCVAPLHRFHAAHLYNFNPATLTAMAEKTGFKVERSVVSEDGGVITAVLRKTEGIHEPLIGKSNYERIRSIIDGHTWASHYLSMAPYVRPFRRLARRISENRAVAETTNGTEILDMIVASIAR
jgi:2-polyprenyl-3-methyl-5-hydroxy-6-metoxy-1,4-benzoquinol methylase